MSSTTSAATVAIAPSTSAAPTTSAAPMRWAVVCCDGLPVSGLLTVLRNVIELGHGGGWLAGPVPADLGFSWRPDKPRYFPDGGQPAGYPLWLDVSTWTPPDPHPDDRAERLTSVRDAVARLDELTTAQQDELEATIEEMAAPYEEHFGAWFAEHDVDWVCAINMTLSDAVPVTLALHRAIQNRWGGGRPGGALFWDHDLYASCAVVENGLRVYPPAPNRLTPLPGNDSRHLWIVATDGLRSEALSYPTALGPTAVANLLPAVPRDPDERHHQFLRERAIPPGHPILLTPVRMWRPKGVDIAVELLARICSATDHAGEVRPYLLVFGSLDEDPDYSAEVIAQVERLGLAENVCFLDGVPLASARGDDGRWRLDEGDLLTLAVNSGGAVVFTPSQPDIESVGLGPALAAIAGVPCAVTPYDRFEEIYSDAFSFVAVRPDTAGLTQASASLLATMRAYRDRLPDAMAAAELNERIVRNRFPTAAWKDLLRVMHRRSADAPGQLEPVGGERQRGRRTT